MRRRSGSGSGARGDGAPAPEGPRGRLGEVEAVPTGRVTALHERKAGSARYVVSIDGRVVATVSAQVIAELGLRVGGSIDDALASRLREEASRLAIFDKAVALLAVRARSVRELRTRLARAGASEEGIRSAIDRLEQLGLVDDAAYARHLALSRVVGGGVSKRRIGEELQRKGITRGVADAAITETLAEVELDEVGAARAAADKRLRALRSYDPDTRRRRLYAFLARRGYAPDVVARVLREVLRGDGDVEGDGGDGGDEAPGDETP